MNAKAKGSRCERRTIAMLEAAGYKCMKAGASLGVFDVIGIGSHDVVLVQVKSNRWPLECEMEALRLFPVPANWAGYSARTAQEQSSRLLSNVMVASRAEAAVVVKCRHRAGNCETADVRTSTDRRMVCGEICARHPMNSGIETSKSNRGRLKNGNRSGDYMKAPRCGARNRQGQPCRCPAIRGKQRCRLHGGKSTGPRTKEGFHRIRSANWKDGSRSARLQSEAKLEARRREEEIRAHFRRHVDQATLIARAMLRFR